jgi:hypothetical protein
MIRSIALVLVLCGVADAGPYKETLTKAEVAAIVKATQDALPKVDPGVTKCNVYLDGYNKDPEHNIDQIPLAAKCFRAAGALSAAITNWNVFIKYEPSSKDAVEATRELGRAYEAGGFFDRAADSYETYAKKYAGEKDAKDLMTRAVCIRRQLGDTKADADANYLVRVFKGPTDADALCDQVRPIAMPTKTP